MLKEKMHNTALVFCLLFLAIGQIMFAQEKQKEEAPLVDLTTGSAFELSPHTGMMGGSGVFGVRMGMNYGALGIEAAGEQVIGKTANLFPITLNFALNLVKKGKLLPYAAVGGGLFITKPTDAIGARTVSTPGVSFGGGTRLYLSESFGFRMEFKQYMTSVSSNISASDELLIFQEITLGVSLMFK